MRGDRLLTDYFHGRINYMRRFMDNVEIGETLRIKDIAERSGIPETKAYGFMKLLEARGMADRVPFVWPTPPAASRLWGRAKWRRWRIKAGGVKRGYPGARWRYLGFTVTPVDELLSLARLDLGVEAITEMT